jgi:hypothetical protein
MPNEVFRVMDPHPSAAEACGGYNQAKAPSGEL